MDHLLALEPADCVLYFKTKMAVNINTMSGWDDDNYDTVTQCQSVWTCFFLSISGFSASWRNILKASGGFAPRSPPGLCPGLSWGTCVPQTTCQCPTQTKIKDLPLEPRWLLAIHNDACSCNNARSEKLCWCFQTTWDTYTGWTADDTHIMNWKITLPFFPTNLDHRDREQCTWDILTIRPKCLLIRVDDVHMTFTLSLESRTFTNCLQYWSVVQQNTSATSVSLESHLNDLSHTQQTTWEMSLPYNNLWYATLVINMKLRLTQPGYPSVSRRKGYCS